MSKTTRFTVRFAAILMIAAHFSGFSVTSVSAQSIGYATPNLGYGWDYNMTKRCVRTGTSSATTTYFADTSQCPANGTSWLATVQSERAPGQTCSSLGPVNQSFKFNGNNSPVHLTYLPWADEAGRPNWLVSLATDFQNNSHPCGGHYFTANGFFDHDDSYMGGPHPPLSNADLSVLVAPAWYVPTGRGAVRVTVGVQIDWAGHFYHLEIDVGQQGWGDPDPRPDIVFVRDQGFRFIEMDGNAMGLGVANHATRTLRIHWHSIARNLVSRGIIDEPPATLASARVVSMFVGTEVKNEYATNGPTADLWFSNFRSEFDTLGGNL